MKLYYTSGQVAKSLRISVSTLKRWLSQDKVLGDSPRNSAGWRLFSEQDVAQLKTFKREKKKNGRRFRATTLRPVEKAS